MLPQSQTKPEILPWQRGFSGGKKWEEYAKPHTERRGMRWREDRADDCGCNSRSPVRDAVGSKKELIPLRNSILPEPGQPRAQLSKLMHLKAWKKTKHTISRWYRAVYIPCLVTYYDMLKTKRWLNSNPRVTGVKWSRNDFPSIKNKLFQDYS